MNATILITGGCRSGKSRHALELAQQAKGNHKTFIATCVPQDDEMLQRVARHKAERNSDWQTIEEPVKIADVISKHQVSSDVILVDCLTLWMNNLLMASEDFKIIENRIQQLTQALQLAAGTVILVSNEVGSGIVPENRLARLFRDAAGLVNQRVASCADKVIWMVAGIPVVIKAKGLRTKD